MICPKIKSRIFESEDEQRLHTGAELYETFYGEDYEKGIRAAVDHLLLNKYDNRFFFEIKEFKRSWLDKLDRPHASCKHCDGCYNECVTDLARMDKMLDIVGTRWPLLFDQRIDYVDQSGYMYFDDWSEEDAIPEDHLVPPCEPDEISLD